MRILRALLVALLTALVGSVLALLVGDHLTTLVRVPEIEGQRGMMMFFVCIPLGMIASLVIGTTTSVLVHRAQGWSLLVLCVLAGALGGVPYLLWDKPPKLDGRHRDLEFELLFAATLTIPAQPDGDNVRVSLYTNNKQKSVRFHRLGIHQEGFPRGYSSR